MINKKQKGSVLLECMISVLLFAMGILSIMKFQGSLISENNTAEFRIMASNMGEDLLGMVLLDANNADNYTVLAGTANAGTVPSGLQDWADRVAALPNGEANVTVGPNPADGTQKLISIEIKWCLPTSDCAILNNFNKYTVESAIIIN